MAGARRVGVVAALVGLCWAWPGGAAVRADDVDARSAGELDQVTYGGLPPAPPSVPEDVTDAGGEGSTLADGSAGSSGGSSPNLSLYWSNNAAVSAGGCGVLRGSSVVGAQLVLALHGQLARSGSVDGIAGPKTDAAIRSWQRAHNLAVDGCVGPDTWSSLQFSPHTESSAGSAHPSLVYRSAVSCPSSCRHAYFDMSLPPGMRHCVISSRPGLGGYSSAPVLPDSYYVMVTSGSDYRTTSVEGRPSCASY